MKKIRLKIKTEVKAGADKGTVKPLYGITPLYGVKPLYGIQPLYGISL